MSDQPKTPAAPQPTGWHTVYPATGGIPFADSCKPTAPATAEASALRCTLCTSRHPCFTDVHARCAANVREEAGESPATADEATPRDHGCPLTTKALWHFNESKGDVVGADFARDLERQLQAAQHKLAEERKAHAKDILWLETRISCDDSGAELLKAQAECDILRSERIDCDRYRELEAELAELRQEQHHGIR